MLQAITTRYINSSTQRTPKNIVFIEFTCTQLCSMIYTIVYTCKFRTHNAKDIVNTKIKSILCTPSSFIDETTQIVFGDKILNSVTHGQLTCLQCMQKCQNVCVNGMKHEGLHLQSLSLFVFVIPISRRLLNCKIF